MASASWSLNAVSLKNEIGERLITEFNFIAAHDV
jgi:hypothetical protein